MGRTVDSETVVKPGKMAHFVLRVRNLRDSIDWYSKVLGMEIVHDGGFIAFLTYDDEHHRMAMVETPVKDDLPDNAAGLDHVAYTLADLGELLGTYKRLKALDILPVWPINHGLTTSIYYADPDGNRVEFQVENLGTKDELNGYMRSDAFAENPIGVDFDPEKLLARYENGDPLEELVQFGSA